MAHEPGHVYSRENESIYRADVERQLRMKHDRRRDIEFAGDERLILVSPDGTRYTLTVDNAGVLGTTAA